MPSTGLLLRVSDFLRAEGLVESDALLVVGVSGGVDSMVLMDVLHRLDVPLLAAHVNYGLRGDESDADEALVRRRCAELGVPLETARYETRSVAEERGLSLQQAARELRYAFFSDVAAAEGASAVAVGHHADDQAETVLLNLFRGTGVTGLAGMPASRPLNRTHPITLIRPLLGERRRDLEAFARAHTVPWREDASNASEDYLRAIVRHRILPLVVETVDDDVSGRIARTAGFVRAYLDEVLDPALRARFDACARVLRPGGMLLLEPLRDLAPVWRSRLLLEALAHWLPGAPRDAGTAARLESLMGAQVGRKLPLVGGIVWREREGLRFQPTVSDAEKHPDVVHIQLDEGVHAVPGGTLTLRRANRPFEVTTGPYEATVDAAAVSSPLVYRPWQNGDVLQPLGMTGHKKVSDVLTDAKVRSSERSVIRVLESDGRILWIPGVRLSEWARVTARSESVWMIRFDPNET